MATTTIPYWVFASTKNQSQYSAASVPLSNAWYSDDPNEMETFYDMKYVA
jgi:hypothetical protein